MPLSGWLRKSRGVSPSGNKDTESSGTQDAAPPTGPDAPGVSGDKSLAQLRDGMAAIRQNIRAFGAAVGTGATAIIAGVGWTTVHNLFPPPHAHPGLGWLGAGLGVIAVLAALLLTALFFAAQRRVVFQPSDPQKAPGLAAGEKHIVEQVLSEHAAEEGATSAAALEMRALRLERIARERATPYDTTTKALMAEAVRLNDRLAIASVRAAASVVESRNEALFRASGKNGALWAASFASLSIIALFFLADYAKGQRDLIDLQAKCAKATAAQRPTSCTDVAGQSPAPTPPPTTTVTVTPSPNLGLISSVRRCARALPEASALPSAVRRQALLTCAGIPATSSDASQ